MLAACLGDLRLAAARGPARGLPRACSGDVRPRALRLRLRLAIPVLIGRVFLQAILDSEYRFSFSNGVRLLAPVSGVVANSLLGIAGELTVTTAMTAWLAGQTALDGPAGLVPARRMEGFGRPDRALASAGR